MCGKKQNRGGLLVLLGLCALASDAHAYEPMKTKAGELVRWWHPAITFTLGAPEPEEIDRAAVPDVMLALFDQWIETACGLVPEVTYGGDSPATETTSPATTETDNVVIFARSNAAWAKLQRSTTELAITLVARDEASGQIVDADMVINDATHKFTIADTAAAGEIRLQTVLVHEIGHFFGLDHSAEADAIMFKSYDLTHDTLTADDESGICFLYTDVPPLPKPTPADPGGCAGGDATGGALAVLGLALARRRMKHAAHP